MSADASGAAFGARTIIILIAAGVICFAAFLVLTAYAPDMRSGRDARGHALSTSAVGLRGIHDLLEELDYPVEYIRDETLIENEGLLIATIEPGRAGGDLAALVERGRTQPTLIVLPKWLTMAMPGSDRVRSIGPAAAGLAGEEISEIGAIAVATAEAPAGDTLYVAESIGARFAAPAALQTIHGKALSPLIETARGDIVLGNLTGTELYVLADPDLINNLALANEDSAAAAVAMLVALNLGGPFRFDLTLPGFGASPNLLKLAFEPPFLALTLCILAAAMLAGAHAAHRFGPARHEPRAIAFGKRALVDNSADLIRVAGRERLSAERYVTMTREAAITAIGNPRRLEGEALDRWLDGFTRGESPPFTALAACARTASTRHGLLDAARALHQWKRTVTHDR